MITDKEQSKKCENEGWLGNTKEKKKNNIKCCKDREKSKQGRARKRCKNDRKLKKEQPKKLQQSKERRKWISSRRT